MTADERVEPTTVTVGWILEALDGKVPQWDKLRKESKIKCFETHLISGAGFLSNVLRLRVVFENGEHFPLILKATTTDKLTALYLADETAPTVDPSEDTTTMLIVSYHNQEINFYENIGNQYKGFQLAKMYGSKRSTLHPVEHGQILLEDVSHLGMLADNRVGLNLQQCESVIKTIANFHAYTLSLPNINEILKKMPNMMDAFEESAFDFVKSCCEN
ncbi:hypothetical protein M3Y97_00115200 [Aphelenchoides bicaudatus]|nr:hypothetical protein M3Y97_00115200 [Aphelenchoides bicaudatus]